MVRHIPQKPRGKHRKRERKLILLAVEGRRNRTETGYFNQFNREQKEYRINFVSCNETDPIHLVKKAETAWQSEKCDAEFGDLVYCVFDTDTDSIKQREIDEAIRQAGRSNVGIVLSNPCFEVWFILHFGYTSKQFQSNEEVLRELRKNIPDYEKSADVFSCVQDKTEKAIQNAKRLEQFHAENHDRRGIECNPGTEVYKIVEKLIFYQRKDRLKRGKTS